MTLGDKYTDPFFYIIDRPTIRFRLLICDG